MKIKMILLAILFTVCSCEKEEFLYQPKDDLRNYRCTTQQLKTVDAEFNICSKSGYFNNHCFLTAKASICEYIYKPEAEVKL